MNRTDSSPVVRHAGRAGRVLSGLVLVAVTAVGLVYLLPSLVGYERYVITGGSMSSAFEKGSIAFERPVPVDELEVGDVITYLPPADSGITSLVTHRIVSLDRSGPQPVLVTRGDANADPDPWVFELGSPVQPVVMFTIPLLGYVFIALADPSTRMLVIGVPAAAVALRSLGDLVRAVRGPGQRKPGEVVGEQAALAGS